MNEITATRSTYNDEIASEICNAIACSSKGIKRLCEDNPHWPCEDTIFEWLKNNKAFSEQYAEAKRCQVEVLIDEILEISDDSSKDVIIRTNKNGEEYEAFNTEHINRSRLKVDTRKWIAAKLAPKIYGSNTLVLKTDGIDIHAKHRDASSEYEA